MEIHRYIYFRGDWYSSFLSCLEITLCWGRHSQSHSIVGILPGFHVSMILIWTFLGFQFSICNLELRESEIRNVGKGVFTTFRRGPDHVVSIYYGTMLYEKLSVGASSRPAVHGEGALVVPVKGFLK